MPEQKLDESIEPSYQELIDSKVIETNEKINDEIINSYQGTLTKENISEKIKPLIDQWTENIRDELKKKDNFSLERNKLKQYKENFDKNKLSLKKSLIIDFEKLCNKSGVAFDNSFWQEQLANKKRKERKLALELLLKKWEEILQDAELRQNLENIEISARQLKETLLKGLKVVEKLDEKITSLGLSFGKWFDSSIGELSENSIEELEKYLEYFESNYEIISRIAEILGRMFEKEQELKLEWVTETHQVKYPFIDFNLKEEITGIRLGKDIEYILPVELSLLSDRETDILFDLKYLEEKLLCFELQGYNYSELSFEKQYQQEVEIESENEDTKGPMILCIDTSGSMSGEPENIAKAVALYLAGIAESESRKYFIINFSVEIVTYELHPRLGINGLIKFLSNSFHGGTDITLALEKTLDMMEKEDYKRADLLVISDMQMDLPNNILDKMSAQKEKGSKFYSLVIDTFENHSSGNLSSLFDKEWIYNFQTKNITELISVGKELLN